MHKIRSLIILDEDSPIHNLKDGKIQLSENPFLDNYILDSGKALQAVDSAIEKAQKTIDMLDPEFLDVLCANGDSKGDYIQLLVENSIIRVQTIYDRALILANRVLDLGIANKFIGHELIVSNFHVKCYSLDTPLKNIHKACKEYREVRNTVIHHDRYSEDNLDSLSLILAADSLSKEAGQTSPVGPGYVQSVTEGYLDLKRRDLRSYLRGITREVNALYDKLIPVYKMKRDEIRSSHISASVPVAET